MDWTGIAISIFADELDMDWDLWDYCKSVVDKVLDGDIDTYLEIIDRLRPVDDLIAYAGDFEFGTDTPYSMSVEYTCLAEDLLENGEDDALFEELLNAVAIRVARDLTALLPIRTVNVFVVNRNGDSIFDITFTRRFLKNANYRAYSAIQIVEQQRRENDL